MQLREVYTTLTTAFLVLAMHTAPNQTRVLLDALHTTVCGPTKHLEHMFILDMQH